MKSIHLVGGGKGAGRKEEEHQEAVVQEITVPVSLMSASLLNTSLSRETGLVTATITVPSAVLKFINLVFLLTLLR